MNGPTTDRQRRQAAQRRGIRAEQIAAWWLRIKGYRIIAADVTTPAGQIDLIARRGRVLAIVEVKQRGGLNSALDALAPRQQIRLTNAASALLGRYPRWSSLNLRFDIVAIIPGRWPQHIVDAWRPTH